MVDTSTISLFELIRGTQFILTLFIEGSNNFNIFVLSSSIFAVTRFFFIKKDL